MGRFLDDDPPPPPPPQQQPQQPAVGMTAATIPQQQQQQQPAPTRSPPDGRGPPVGLAAARPYSRQNTTISPVEADMPPFNAG